MSRFHLEKYTLKELQSLADKMDLPIGKTKEGLIKNITIAFLEYEKYKQEKKEKYKIKKQLGNKGKEGVTYLVIDKNDNQYAMKTFKKTKSSKKLYLEFYLQKKASKAGVAPIVYEYDTVGKWIVMEKMDSHLLDKLKEGYILTKKDQERIIEIYKELDDCGVFHNDANLCNYMIKKNKIYLIDYGFSKKINSALVKKVGTDRPNSKLMLIGFILKLKENNVNPFSYKYLMKKVEKEDRERYNLT